MKKKATNKKYQDKNVLAIFYNKEEHRTESIYFSDRAQALLYGIGNDLYLITISEELQND